MSNPIVTGPINNVPCPHCGKHMSFEAIREFGLESGVLADCDHCEGTFEIVNVDRRPRVSVRIPNE